MGRRDLKIGHRPTYELIVNGVPLHIDRRATITVPKTVSGCAVAVTLKRKLNSNSRTAVDDSKKPPV